MEQVHASQNTSCTSTSTSTSTCRDPDLDPDQANKKDIITNIVGSKIKALLDNSDLKSDERSLVVLTLLARADAEDHYVETYFSTELFNFCIRLIDSTQDTETDTYFYQLVSSLVCQIPLPLRTETYPYKDPYSYRWHNLGHKLMDALRKRQALSIQTVDIALIHAIDHCLCATAIDTPHSLSLHERALSIVWERYINNHNQAHNNLQHIHIRTDIPTQDTDTDADPLIDYRYDRHHDNSIKQIIGRLVVQDCQKQSLPTLWDQSCLNLWTTHAPAICDRAGSTSPTPTWYQPMLHMLCDKNNTSAHQKLNDDGYYNTLTIKWLQNILLYTRLLSRAGALHPANIAPHIIPLITAHIAANESSLKVDAWQTCATIASSSTWTNELQGSHLTLFTNLAVGEYRIQLGLALEKDTAVDADELRTCETLIDACGQIILNAFQRIMDHIIPEDTSNASAPNNTTAIPANQLLTLSGSFLDVLHSTIQYLNMTPTQPFLTPCKLLCHLLKEFSLWTDLPADLSPIDALNAIALLVTLNLSNVLPCLAEIFVMVQDDDQKIEILNESRILDLFPTAIIHFWTDDPVDQHLISWACKATEYWWMLSRPSEKESFLIASHILRYVRRQVERGITAESSSSTSLSVGCFVVLMGDHMPEENDAQVIESALVAIADCSTIE